MSCFKYESLTIAKQQQVDQLKNHLEELEQECLLLDEYGEKKRIERVVFYLDRMPLYSLTLQKFRDIEKTITMLINKTNPRLLNNKSKITVSNNQDETIYYWEVLKSKWTITQVGTTKNLNLPVLFNCYNYNIYLNNFIKE